MTGGRVIFVGAVHEAVPALGALIDSGVEIAEVVTLPAERSAGTSGFVDLEPMARANGIAVRRCADINAAESVRHVERLRPDLMVVTGWTRLLSAELLGVPPRGVIGFHASLLPRYRGRAPVNWAILRGDTVTGNTMMYLDAGTDTGDIVDQQAVPITQGDTCATVYARVGEAGAEMLRRQLRGLLDGTAARRPQGPGDGPPLPKRTPEMGITDWNRPARAVHDWIRALTSPYPGAFTFIAGRKLMLWASAVDQAEHKGPGPGTVTGTAGKVLGCDESGMRVAVADGTIVLTSVSDPGCPPEAASAWAGRNGMRPGDEFEPVPSATAAWVLGLGPRPAENRAVLFVDRTRVVVIGAHPDDELLGAGGTLARHVLEGDEVHAIVVADGAGSRYPTELVSTLEKQARRAAEVIGFASLQFLSLPDQRLDAVPLIELTQRLECVLDEIEPGTVYTHFPEDVNADHGVVAKCAWTACRPYARPLLRKFAVFATPSSTEWAWPMPGTEFHPNLFVDVTDTLESKIAAMECYATELRDYPHPRSSRALREHAAYWGSRIGRLAAEPFLVLREVT